MSDAWISLIGTLFGGAGLKLIEFHLSRRSQQAAPDSLVDEMHRELEDSRKEADDNRQEADLWRQRYYSLVAFVSAGDINGALVQIHEHAKEH